MSEKPDSTISEGLKFTSLIYRILKSQDSVQSIVRTVTYTIISLNYSLKKSLKAISSISIQKISCAVTNNINLSLLSNWFTEKHQYAWNCF